MGTPQNPWLLVVMIAVLACFSSMVTERHFSQLCCEGLCTTELFLAAQDVPRRLAVTVRVSKDKLKISNMAKTSEGIGLDAWRRYGSMRFTFDYKNPFRIAHNSPASPDVSVRQVSLGSSLQ